MSSQQVQSMECSNEIGCEGNYNGFIIIISNEFFFFFNGFDFQAKFDKRNQFKKYLACDVHFVCATQKT